MKGLDTNILIRFLVNDDKRQGEIVRSLFLKAEKRSETFFVSSTVLLEVIYVLDSVYGFSRTDILGALDSLLAMPILVFDQPDVAHKLILEGGTEKAELEDMLIALQAKEAGASSTLTFDRKAAKYGGFKLLG